MLQTIQTVVDHSTTQPDAALSEARRRLETWGNWLRAITIRDIGYPSQVAFAQQRMGAPVDYDNEEAEAVEALLASMMNMPERVGQYRVLVQAYYFRATVRAGCERVKMPRSTYDDQLKRGERYVADFFSGRD